MVAVQILGPNLDDQSKGTFHVHRVGCADIKKYGPRPDGWNTEAETYEDVAREVYADFLDPTNGEMTLDDALGDIHFLPCSGLREE